MDFNKLKSNSGKAALAALTQELSKLNTFADADPRFWRPTTDKVGNGYAVIRFLPAGPADGEDAAPFIRQFRHKFKGPTGAFYNELSLTTIGQQDPVGEHNSRLWNSGIESDKELARLQKRKTEFISNIYVINDPATPENNGRVFLFRYGVKIFDKIQAKMHPEFEGEQGFNPYDLWAGANFKMKVKRVQDFPNYDSSEFDAPAPLFQDDKKLEAVWRTCHSLKEMNDPKHFKSYEELKRQFNRVIGTEAVVKHSAPRQAEEYTTKPDGQKHDARVEALIDTPPWDTTDEAPVLKRADPKPQAFDPPPAAEGDIDDFIKSLASRNKPKA